MDAKPRRRWYQFSLKTLLAPVVITAATSSWYGYRVRVLERERTRVVGRWYAAVDDFLAVTWVADGTQILMPNEDVGRFNGPMVDGSGTALGIYRWDGDEMVVALADPGRPRPTSFEKLRGVSIYRATREFPTERKALLDAATGKTLMRDSNDNWTDELELNTSQKARLDVNDHANDYYRP